MKRRNFPRILLLVAGVSAGGFLVTQNANAQTRPDPLTGATGEDDALPPTDDQVTGTDVTDRSDSMQSDRMRMTYESTQTTTTGASSLTPSYDDTGTVVEETTTYEREEVTTEAAPPPATTAVPGDTNIYVQDDDDDDDYYYGSGIGLEAGGGVNEFASGSIASMTDTGGAWGARLTLGTRSPLAFEAAYIGTANPIQTLGLDRSTLLSNGAEGALKIHLALAELSDDGAVMLKPYLLAGFAWKRYDLRGDAVNTSNVADSDDVFEIPVGLGLGWNFGRFIADQRFDYRPSLSGSLVRDLNDDNNDEGLQTWSLTARVGVEF